MKSLLGENAKGLSAGTISRLKQQWQEEHKSWSQRDLSLKKYVYIWADGIILMFVVKKPNNAYWLLLVLMNLEKKN